MSLTSPRPFARIGAAAIATLLLATACGDDATTTADAGSSGSTTTTTTVAVASNSQSLTGTVIAATGTGEIPAGATVTVELADTSIADGSAIVIASRTYTDVSSFPFTYELEWADELEPGFDYTISVTVADGDAISYVTDTAFTVQPGDTDADLYVIDVGAGPVDMEIEPALAFGTSILGETEVDAIGAITAAGFESRVAERDGEAFALT
ncbi:MAG: YbaY family lipoprotein, partial [Actinomycetota bacterium]